MSRRDNRHAGRTLSAGTRSCDSAVRFRVDGFDVKSASDGRSGRTDSCGTLHRCGKLPRGKATHEGAEASAMLESADASCSRRYGSLDARRREFLTERRCFLRENAMSPTSASDVALVFVRSRPNQQPQPPSSSDVMVLGAEELPALPSFGEPVVPPAEPNWGISDVPPGDPRPRPPTRS